MTRTLSDDQVRLLRLRAQRLVPQFAREHLPPAQLLKKVGGAQAQELPAALLAMRARDDLSTAAEIERARLEEPTIVRTWAMRGTLHLLAAEDARWMVPMLGPDLIASGMRRLTDLGWDEERIQRGKRILRDALARDGQMTRAEIIDLFTSNGLPHQGQAPVHLIGHAALEGWLCLGPEDGKKPTYVLFEDWIGSPQPLPREEALNRLAQNYLSVYAPASLMDFAFWSGLKMSDARSAWQSIEADRTPAETSLGQLWMLKTQLAWIDDFAGQAPVVRLLPRFDDTILGYATRDLAIDPASSIRILPGGGMILQSLNVNGRILGAWKTQPRRGRIEIVIDPFETLPDALLPELEKEIARIGRFLGVEARRAE
jgi:hypothetical protein